MATMKSDSLTWVAIASSEQKPRTGIFLAQAKVCANVIPTRNPVYGPGPMPTNTSEISRLFIAA